MPSAPHEPSRDSGAVTHEQRLRALLLSLLLAPGAGQVARGRRALGALLGLLSGLLVVGAAVTLGLAIRARLPVDLLEWDGGSLPSALLHGFTDSAALLVPLLGLLVVLWAWSAYDAYRP